MVATYPSHLRVICNSSPEAGEVCEDISSILSNDKLLHRPDAQHYDLGAPPTSERQTKPLLAIGCACGDVGTRVVRVSMLEKIFK